MESNERNTDYTDRGKYNQRIGKELYNQDQERNSHRNEHRRAEDREWGEDTYFHTGPNKRGAQDRDRNSYDYNKGGASNSSYNQGQNAHLNDHYGSRRDSAYRNERSYLNHGDNRHVNEDRYQQGRNEGSLPATSGSRPGNHNEPLSQNDSPYREGPGSRSRYKETDYRYGSGSHNWYRENRYSPDEDRNDRYDDDRGFFERMGNGIRDTWNDIMHADDPDYQSRQSRYEASGKGSDRTHMGSEPYRDRRYDKGYEGGPRWADETDSGRDRYYDDTDRDQRFRR